MTKNWCIWLLSIMATLVYLSLNSHASSSINDGILQSIKFIYNCSYNAITSIKPPKTVTASSHSKCGDFCLSSITCLRFSWQGPNDCDLYLDDKKLGEDFRRYDGKDAVCGFVKNRDINTITKQRIKFSSKEVEPLFTPNLWVSSDGEQVKWGKGCAFDIYSKWDFMYVDYNAGASFNMCADACLYDPRCGAFGWVVQDRSSLIERYCEIIYIHPEEIGTVMAINSIVCGYPVNRVIDFEEEQKLLTDGNSKLSSSITSTSPSTMTSASLASRSSTSTSTILSTRQTTSLFSKTTSPSNVFPVNLLHQSSKNGAHKNWTKNCDFGETNATHTGYIVYFLTSSSCADSKSLNQPYCGHYIWIDNQSNDTYPNNCILINIDPINKEKRVYIPSQTVCGYPVNRVINCSHWF